MDDNDAERGFQVAVKLSPRPAHVHHAYSMHLAIVGRHDEAVAHAKESIELDPLLVSGTL